MLYKRSAMDVRHLERRSICGGWFQKSLVYPRSIPAPTPILPSAKTVVYWKIRFCRQNFRDERKIWFTERRSFAHFQRKNDANLFECSYFFPSYFRLYFFVHGTNTVWISIGWAQHSSSTIILVLKTQNAKWYRIQNGYVEKYSNIDRLKHSNHFFYPSCDTNFLTSDNFFFV